MPLFTELQCINKLLEFNERLEFLGRNPLTLFTNGSKYEIRYRNKKVFTNYPTSFLPFSFELSNKTKLDILDNPILNLKTDLFYHWITAFQEYSTYEKIKTKILERETCASFATTIAVNKYIQAEDLSEKQIAELFKGSPWRWAFICDVWVQKTFYREEYSLFLERTIKKIILNVACLGSTFCINHEITNIVSFYNFFRAKIDQINQELDNIPRELASYSSRATSFFSFKKSPTKAFNTFLGVELELDGHSANEYTSLDILQNHAIFKRDGSVPLGVEICTAPATLDVHKQEFLPFFESLQTKKSKLKANTNCGMHVHVDKASLSTLHIANIYQFVNKAENRDAIVNIAGRQPNTYCQAHITGYEHFTQGGSSERYRMVNLQPENTIEFRIFASTTDYKDFCKKLEFVQAVVDYTRPGEVNIPITKITLWEHFTVYLKQYRKKYPMLNAYLYGEKPKYVSGF